MIPLAIQVGNQLEFCNKNKDDLDEEDLENNIDKVVIEGNLPPYQIDIMKTTKGKKYKKVKNTGAPIM